MAQGSRRAVIAVFVRHAPLVGLAAVAAMNAMQDTLDGIQTLAEADSIAVLGGAGVCWSFEAHTGEPAAELMRAAEAHEAESIVVAGRRHGAIGALARGAIATQLLHRWRRTLVVVHPPISKTSTTGRSTHVGS